MGGLHNAPPMPPEDWNEQRDLRANVNQVLSNRNDEEIYISKRKKKK